MTESVIHHILRGGTYNVIFETQLVHDSQSKDKALLESSASLGKIIIRIQED